MTYTIIIIFLSVSRHKKERNEKNNKSKQVRRFCYPHTEVTHLIMYLLFPFLFRASHSLALLTLNKRPHPLHLFALFSLRQDVTLLPKLALNWFYSPGRP